MTGQTYKPRRSPHFARVSTLVLACLLRAAIANAAPLPQSASTPIPAAGTGWVATWAGSPSSPADNFEFAGAAYNGNNTFSNQTVRLIVHASVGGKRVRIRLSNEESATPIEVGAAHIALDSAGATIVPGSDRPLTFNGGNPMVRIAPGAPVFSDPVKLDVPALADIAVSLYLPGQVTVNTGVPNSLQTNYVAPAASGDNTGTATLPLDPVNPTITQWPLLTGIDVHDSNAQLFVALGSSITLGLLSTPNANERWTDYLAKRLYYDGLTVGVVNASIVANRLLSNSNGLGALARLERDALSEPGVAYIFINDILGEEAQRPTATPDAIIGGLGQIITRAHGQNVKVYAGTILPLGGAVGYSATFETNRQAVNAFIRTGGQLDGFVDFDAALSDPTDPAILNPAYDAGDHEHPNDAGNKVLAHAFDISLFQ